MNLKHCVHFTGIQNKLCNAGVNYDDFRGEERPFKFPCIGQGGECSKLQLPTQEQVERFNKEMDLMGTTAMKLTAAIRALKDVTSGEIDCPCGGKARFAIAPNGHIRARCPSCHISFME